MSDWTRWRVILIGLALGVVLAGGFLGGLHSSSRRLSGSLQAARIKDPPEPKPGGGKRSVEPPVRHVG
ncbi:MAG: hypothetical protein HY320_10220 [Armatimonadetes bacterium]|nr:hypothetical protein [Armatimonadota bacterium]